MRILPLHVRAPEDLHHLLRGVGAGGVPLPAEDLALGGEAQLGGQVVLGLGGGGVDLVLLGLAVTEKEKGIIHASIPSVLHYFHYFAHVYVLNGTVMKSLTSALCS